MKLIIKYKWSAINDQTKKYDSEDILYSDVPLFPSDVLSLLRKKMSDKILIDICEISESSKQKIVPLLTKYEQFAASALQGLCSRTFPENMQTSWVEWATDLSFELANEMVEKSEMS